MLNLRQAHLLFKFALRLKNRFTQSVSLQYHAILLILRKPLGQTLERLITGINRQSFI